MLITRLDFFKSDNINIYLESKTHYPPLYDTLIASFFHRFHSYLPPLAVGIYCPFCLVYQFGNFQARRTCMSRRGSIAFRNALFNAAHNILKTISTLTSNFSVSSGKCWLAKKNLISVKRLYTKYRYIINRILRDVYYNPLFAIDT